MKIRDNSHVQWSGKYLPSLAGEGVYPRPPQKSVPIRIGVGGTPNSFVRAGTLGLPLILAIIGGEPRRFRPLVDLYREAGRRAGHSSEQLSVGIHSVGFLADTTAQAADEFYPACARVFNKIGKERGWPPVTRAQYDATRGATGALLVGDPEAVAEKILYDNEVLGGISRMTMLVNGGSVSHAQAMHAIELLGARVAPIVKKALEPVPVEV